MTDTPKAEAKSAAKPDPKAAPKAFPGSVDGAVLACLHAAKKPATAETIAAEISLPLNTVQRALGKLVSERLVRRAGGGLFSPAAHPGHRQGRRP